MKFCLSILKWLALLPFMVVTDALVVVLAPLAAATAIGRDNLPGPLRWMQTHDNSLDTLWQQPHHLQGYRLLKNKSPEIFEKSAFWRWYARTMWLMRNPGYGLAYKLGYDTKGEPPKVVSQRGKWDSSETNWLILKWEGAWQVRAQIFYFSKGKHYLRIYIGWKSTDGNTKMMYAGHINPFRGWKGR